MSQGDYLPNEGRQLGLTFRDDEHTRPNGNQVGLGFRYVYYHAPEGNRVGLDFSGEYTPPEGNQVGLAFGDDDTPSVVVFDATLSATLAAPHVPPMDFSGTASVFADAALSVEFDSL